MSPIERAMASAIAALLRLRARVRRRACRRRSRSAGRSARRAPSAASPCGSPRGGACRSCAGCSRRCRRPSAARRTTIRRPSMRANPPTIAGSSPNTRSPWSSMTSSAMCAEQVERARPPEVARQLDAPPDGVLRVGRLARLPFRSRIGQPSVVTSRDEPVPSSGSTGSTDGRDGRSRPDRAASRARHRSRRCPSRRRRRRPHRPLRRPRRRRTDGRAAHGPTAEISEPSGLMAAGRMSTVGPARA